MNNRYLSLISLVLLFTPVTIVAHGLEISSVISSAVNNKSRPDNEVVRDKQRKPDQILALLGVRPGMSIVDLSSGSGYYTDILTTVVGENGKVIAHNTPFVVNRFKDTFKIGGPWDTRMNSTAWKKNVVKLISPLDKFTLQEPVDAALLVMFYHDTIWQKSDRTKMNTALFNAIKPGGHYLIIDHSAEEGSGTRDAQTLHRVDKLLVINELTAAGFKLVEDSNILSHPEDSRDYNVFRDAKTKRDQTDRFVLKFLRP